MSTPPPPTDIIIPLKWDWLLEIMPNISMNISKQVKIKITREKKSKQVF